MKNLLCALVCLIPLVGVAGNDISKVNQSVRVEAGQTAGDVSSVNGSIQIEDGATADGVETVNGSVSIGDRTTAGEVRTVNGGVRVGEQSKIADIESVNGRLQIGAGTQVGSGVSAVNGTISLAKATTVGGRVENVNGKISLEAAHVAGGIGTTNGDIDVGAGSKVEGGILVDKPRGRNWSGSKHRTPIIVIGPDAVVEGDLKFEQPVQLYVSDRARIGTVTGATAIRFTGDRPDLSAVEK